MPMRYVVKSSTVTYKNHRLKYYLTNYGALFLVNSLIIMLTGRKILASQGRKSIIEDALTVKMPGGINAPICTGLNGLRQIFADEPDPDLERLAKKLNIVEGDLPVTEDIKLIPNLRTATLPIMSGVQGVRPICVDINDYVIGEMYKNGYRIKLLGSYDENDNLCDIYYNLRDVSKFMKKGLKMNKEMYWMRLMKCRDFNDIVFEVKTGNPKLIYAPLKKYTINDFYGNYDFAFADVHDISSVWIIEAYNAITHNFLKKLIISAKDQNCDRLQQLQNINAQLVQKNNQLQEENKSIKQQLRIQTRLCYNYY